MNNNNNTQTIETRADHTLARPLKVLVPLIKDDLVHAHEAEKQAGMPYYIDAGLKLIEAKAQLTTRSWCDWIKHNFHLSQGTAQGYMRAARKANAGVVFKTLAEARGDKRKFGHEPNWTEPVKDVLRGIDIEEFKKMRHSHSKEEKTERELGLKLIDIGYKVLATKMHPDKGGSADAMRRLNKVRAKLKEAA